MNKLIKYPLTVIGVIIFIYLFGYCVSVQSDAYAITKKFVYQSPSLKREIGEISTIWLKPFSYHLEFSGNEGSAEFLCAIAGNKGSGELKVVLEKIEGIWKINLAELKKTTTRHPSIPY